jgi:hypothetical protein
MEALSSDRKVNPKGIIRDKASRRTGRNGFMPKKLKMVPDCFTFLQKKEDRNDSEN